MTSRTSGGEKRRTKWESRAAAVVALAAFSILTFGGISATEAAVKKRPRLSEQQSHAPVPKVASKAAEGTAKTRIRPRSARPAVRRRPTGEIHVTVVAHHSGQRVAGAKVHLHEVVHHKKHHSAVASKHKSHHSHHRSGRTAVTNASGQASFSHVGAGRYHVTAHKKGVGHGHAHVSLRPGEDKYVTIRLREHGKRKSRAQLGRNQLLGGGQLGKTGKRAHAPVAPHSAGA